MTAYDWRAHAKQLAAEQAAKDVAYRQALDAPGPSIREALHRAADALDAEAEPGPNVIPFRRTP